MARLPNAATLRKLLEEHLTGNTEVLLGRELGSRLNTAGSSGFVGLSTLEHRALMDFVGKLQEVFMVEDCIFMFYRPHASVHLFFKIEPDPPRVGGRQFLPGTESARHPRAFA